MTLSAAVGTLAGGTTMLSVGAAAGWAFGLGIATKLGTAAWWIMLQCAIALVLSASSPADPPTRCCGLALLAHLTRVEHWGAR
jgi:hypothetical protein